MEIRKAYLAIVLQMVIIGLSFMFVKISLEYAGAFDMLSHRFAIAFIVATIPVMLGKITLSITKKGLIVLIPLAVLYPLLFFTFQTLGLGHITSSEAGIIFAATPVFVLVFAEFILKERTTFAQKLSVFISVCGVIFIILMKREIAFSFNTKGIIYILLSAFSTGIYTVLIRQYRLEYSSFSLSYFMMLIGFIVFFIVISINHTIDHTWVNYWQPLFTPAYLFSILYLGVLSSLLTQFLSIYAVARLEASKVGVFNNLSVVITVLAGVIFLNEKLYYYHIIGAIFILIGIVGSQYFSHKR